MHVRYVTKIPCYEHVRLIHTGQGDMQRITNVLAVKYSTRDVSLGKNCSLLADLVLRQIAHEVQVGCSSRLARSFQLPDHEWRDVGRIIGQLMLPPANRQIAPERLAIVQIGSNNRSLEINALLHGADRTILPLLAPIRNTLSQ